jgi:prepilin-type N-terminal cleavage/methylation domain-containing protein
MPINRKLKAFTMMELLVSMTLTGILVAFAFMGYNQIQKLFVSYTVQSKFITDYNQLNKALMILSERAKIIEAQGDKVIAFKTDSNAVLLDMSTKNILLKFSSHTDTFAMEARDMKSLPVVISGQTPLPMIRSFECGVMFQTQKFRVSFRKQYDASTLLRTTLELLPPDEQP